MFNLLDEHHIKINAFRADSASYLYNVLRLIEKKVDCFYEKARMNANLAQAINIDCWEKIETATETIYRGEIQYKPFIKAHKEVKSKETLKTHRLVVSKIEKKR